MINAVPETFAVYSGDDPTAVIMLLGKVIFRYS
ncbi:hypothetical protein [Marinomonas fungiae]